MSIKAVYLAGIAGLMMIPFLSCQGDDPYTPNVPGLDNTTIIRTIVPEPFNTGEKVMPWEVSKFSANNYGNWHYGQGAPYAVRLELMPSGYTHSTHKKKSTLLRFFTLTDIHLTDKESPAQSIYYSLLFKKEESFPGTISCYSPAMLYSTHVLNASVQTINKLNSQSAFDFGISLGDMGNSSMYNETRWFIDILDGKNINPDSGAKDDPVAGPGNDYQDTYQAEGLSKSIPWYATVGNHDHFFMGSQPFNDKVINNLPGEEILKLGNIFIDPKALDANTFSMGTLDGRTVNGDIIGTGVAALMTSIPTIPSDPNRHMLTKDQMMKEFLTSTSNPAGHGFNQPDFFDGCYSFEPKASLPLKIIVLDDTMGDTDYLDTPGMMGGYGCGTLAHGRFEWLVKQLQDGQKEDKLMIIAAHVPIGVEKIGSPIGWSDSLAQLEILTELQKYPNFILWVAGHRHVDKVNAFLSTDNEKPENGFWEVETRSLREFPQQFRTFDIKWNGDNTVSIFATDVDPIVENNAMAARSRSLAIAAYQTYGRTDSISSTNVELVKMLTPRMEATISKYISNSGN
jgi:metallophosphoesterase (TIGR03768 family)